MAVTLTRKVKVGNQGPPAGGETVIFEDTFASLPVENPITLANLRTALGVTATELPTDNSTMRGRIQTTLQTVDGVPNTKCLTITLPNSDQGVVFQPKLTTNFDWGYIEYDFRFRSGFNWGGGGKMWGLAGYDATRSSPPAGNSPSPHGWGGRHMWLKDSFGGNPSGGIEWIGYKYWPGQTSGTSGVNLHTNVSIGTEGGASAGDWHHTKSEYKMNDTNITNTATDPNTLVQGVDYQANGWYKVSIDNPGSPQYNNEVSVLRFYESANINAEQFSFFFGGDATWAGGNGMVIDIANPRVVSIT